MKIELKKEEFQGYEKALEESKDGRLIIGIALDDKKHVPEILNQEGYAKLGTVTLKCGKSEIELEHQYTDRANHLYDPDTYPNGAYRVHLMKAKPKTETDEDTAQTAEKAAPAAQ